MTKEQKTKNFNSSWKGLPTAQGVFYVHNAKGTIIYIGKGINIKAEVNQLFTKEGTRAVKIQERTASD